MHSFKVLNLFTRFIGNNVLSPYRNISSSSPLQLNVTNVLFAEPLKKKKKMDPALIRAREERKRRKLEKSIRRLEKHAKQLKPIHEVEVTTKMLDELPLRKRHLAPPSAEILEGRVMLLKEWTRFKTNQYRESVNIISGMIADQEKALEKLRNESEDLYLAAIEIDPELLPYSAKGPTATVPIENFDSPDGEYTDITRKYEGEG